MRHADGQRPEEERREVVVIGGGIAGLAAAWSLRHRDVLLLEAGDRLGGRLRSEPRGAYWLNLGAHLLPGPASLVGRMAAECGLESVPVWGGMMGLAVGDTRLTGGRVETYPLRLPLRARERVAFARAGLRVQLAVAAYARAARPRPGETAADTRARVLAHRGDESFAAFLGPLPPPVREIFACAARRATAEPDELSAGCGLGLFALVWHGRGSLIARSLVGGTGRLPEALGARLGDRARTGCRVRALEPDGAEVVVRHARGSVRARQVVVAAQAPHAAGLVAPVSRPAADALARMTYGAFLSVAVQTRETGPMPWDGTYAMATPGRAFDMFTNQAHALRARAGAPGPRRPGGSLLLFAGGPKAAALARESDERIVDRFLRDLRGLFPQARDVVADAVVHRWELGNVFAHPGRHRLQAALEGPLGPHGNVHLAGDYFAELGNMEAAARTGLLAAEAAQARLPADRGPGRAAPAAEAR